MTSPPTTVLLIRHGHTDAIGTWLAGRTRGVPLSASGTAQIERLGRALAGAYRLAAIYTSPLERAHATAAALARYQQVAVEESEDLVDIDFGAWTGKTFLELNADPLWHTFNTTRATAAVPGGEWPGVVQQRIVHVIERLAGCHPNQTVALVTHADLVRFALLHYRSMSLDLYGRFDIDPASVTALSVCRAETKILYVNNVDFAAAP